MTMQTRRCPVCGVPHKANSRACEECGEPLGAAADPGDIYATRPFSSSRDGDVDGPGQRTEVFEPVRQTPAWADVEAVDEPVWEPDAIEATARPDAVLDPMAAPGTQGHGVILGWIAVVLIGLVAAAVLWLTFFGPEIPDPFDTVGMNTAGARLH